MAKNYFGVPQLNEEQHKIAKFLKIESTDTIGILVGLIKTYPDAHWLVAGWLNELLVSDQWGSSWSEVFSDLAKHFGNERTELTGAERLRGLILERTYDNNDANLAELLEEFALVVTSGANVTMIQPKIEHSQITGCGDEPHFVAATKNILDKMISLIEERGFSTTPALMWAKEPANNKIIWAADTITLSRNLICGQQEPCGDYNSWWEFIATLADALPDIAAVTGHRRTLDNRTITLACLITALNILSGRKYDQDTIMVFYTPGTSPDLKTRWDLAVSGPSSCLPEIMQTFAVGVLKVLETQERLKNQASIPTRPSFTGFAGPIAYTSIPEGESVVQAAKNDTKEAVAMAFKMRVGIPSTKLLLVDLFFQPANYPNRSTWLPLEYDKVEAIKTSHLPSADAKEETKAVASFVRAFMANLKEVDVTGVTFFQAYWLMQAATKKSFQNVLDRYSRFYPDTAVLSASWEVDRLKELFKDKKNLEVFWKTAKDFISQ